ncbi:MAG: PTS glucose transporter subunit IIA [Bowdeniella nasicola]|nr:PTS glucose transporter subunit IIA [Bowdeniella nasicola]
MTETIVRAPFAGHVIEVTEVPDEVFATEVLGPGLAIWPERERIPVLAPISGEITSWHPHACTVSAEGLDILVHLGVDTVHLRGKGYRWRVQKGTRVDAAQLIASWDRSVIGNFMPVTPIVVMGEYAITRLADDAVGAGEPLFSVDIPA